MMFCICMPVVLYIWYMLLKWSVEEASKPHAVLMVKGRNVNVRISRASDFWVVICHPKKFRTIDDYVLRAYWPTTTIITSRLPPCKSNIGVIVYSNNQSIRDQRITDFLLNTVLYYIIVRKAVM